MAQDFFAFSDACAPNLVGARGTSTDSDLVVDADFANESADWLNLEEFDQSQQSSDTWDMNLYGLSPFPFGRL
jgi:hypothetical protein